MPDHSSGWELVSELGGSVRGAGELAFDPCLARCVQIESVGRAGRESEARSATQETDDSVFGVVALQSVRGAGELTTVPVAGSVIGGRPIRGRAGRRGKSTSAVGHLWSVGSRRLFVTLSAFKPRPHAAWKA
jgi:hypothetical protein